MFAGLPGIGVGTLFYVLMALWMPLPELVRVVQGTSSVNRWRMILRQLFYALSIVVSIMTAERVLMWMLGQAGPESLSPAHWIGKQVNAHAPESTLGMPVIVSLLLLGAVLLTIEVMRLISQWRSDRRTVGIELSRPLGNDVLNSSPQ